MKDIVACFGHNAVKVAESTLSLAFDGSSPPQSDNTVCCSYGATLSSRKQLLIELTWRRIASGDAFLTVSIDLDGSATHRVILRKKKGSRAFSAGAAACALHWDVSAAKFAGAAPDPTKDFYLVIIADQELVLQLGDLSGHFVERMEPAPRAAEYCAVLYARRERVFGSTHHSTKAVFRDGGSEHEVMVRCKGGEGGSGEAATGDDGELYFCVDRKRLIDVREVNLNFRGNRTIYLDGSAIDVLWDVHDWWFRGSASASSSGATFMFRTRSATESSLWWEEEMAKEDLSQVQRSEVIKDGDGSVDYLSSECICTIMQEFDLEHCVDLEH
ncbi:uncharacterized protein LOC122011360 isoform X1 [Zingiber officinale]|uniref:uncharacterized protein LOC122011360 isoform X1 n=1 Tax=Zingiber officinale TaxID=94328 RepID=UPI001C4CE3EF|nr:uncharacterized protein LOC122011360 isoform X1 [Zingiber officinale]